MNWAISGKNVRFFYDGDGARFLKIEQPPDSPQRTTYYLHGDHLGSTSLTIDQNGDVDSEGRYLPYGRKRWTDGVSPTDFGFTAQRHEDGFGLMDYNGRYYDPLMGRFISPDPLIPEPENPQAFNRFAYVHNNPLRYTDPTGYFTEDEIKESLRKFYQDNGYDDVDRWVEHTWEMWQEDPNFLQALEEGQIGGNIWASHMRIDGEFVPGHGVFSPGQDGRIVIDWYFGDKQSIQLELYQLQGQGAYQISNGAGEIWSSCGSGSCFRFQENFNYLGGVPITSAIPNLKARLGQFL